MTGIQLGMVHAGTRVRSRKNARLGTVMQRRLTNPLEPDSTSISVQMDDGTTIELDTVCSVLANLDFLVGGYVNECESCGAQAAFLAYLSVDIGAARAWYTCVCCGYGGACRIMVV